MRIDKNLPVQPNDDVERLHKKSAPTAESAGAGVTSQLSKDTVRLKSLAAQANAAPEIRQDKVVSLQETIAQGTYQVSHEVLADSILRDALH